MKLKTMPKEIACELLVYIAEKEDFSKVVKALDGEMSASEIKALLREIAAEFQNQVKIELSEEYDIAKCKHLSMDSKKVISYLSPNEEKKLLKAFGLADKN